MILTEDEVYYVSGSLLDVLGHDLDHERVEKLRASHEELRQRAETAERELAADLPYRERWQQAQDENQELRARLAGMKQEKKTWRVIKEGATATFATEHEARQFMRDYGWHRLQSSDTPTLATEWKDADQEVKRG